MTKYEKGGCFRVIQILTTTAVLTAIVIWGILKH